MNIQNITKFAVSIGKINQIKTTHTQTFFISKSGFLMNMIIKTLFSGIDA